MIVPQNPGWLWIKLTVEILLASVLLLIAVPIILVAASVVKMTSRGPALYWQTRVGLRGREFQLCKIRTMVSNAEALSGPVWATTDDVRITRVGAFLRNTHIDELPQLLHVLSGTMSLIGPRPERPEFVSKLQWEYNHYTDRVNVRPGITGLAQLRLPPDSTIENVGPKLDYDLFYVRNVSPWLDLRILFFTMMHAIGRFGGILWSTLSLPHLDDHKTASNGDTGSRRMTVAHRAPRD